MSERTIGFYDRYALSYKGKDGLDRSRANMLEVDVLEGFLGLPAGSRLIELGCGVGRLALPLLKKGYKVTGVDISRESLSALEELAKKRGLGASLEAVEANFNDVVYEGVFDGAYCASTVHLLADTPEGRHEVFKNLVLSVKEGGVVVVSQPNPFNPLFILYLIFSRSVSWGVEKAFLRYNLSNLKALFSNSGLKSIRYGYYGMLPTRWINRFPHVYKINAWLCGLPLLRHFSAFIFIRGVRRDG